MDNRAPLRWPSRYAFKLTMHTPDKRDLDLVTDCEELVASVVITLLTLSALRLEITPSLARLLEDVVEECTAIKNRKNAPPPLTR